jgi:hypothetical protein
VTEFSQALIANLEDSYRVVKPVPTLLQSREYGTEKGKFDQDPPRDRYSESGRKGYQKHVVPEPVIPLLGLTKSHSRQDQAS